MHLAEGILPASHAAACAALAAPAVVWSLRRVDRSALPTLGMASALLFAVTLFPMPVPIVGMTSHMCATPALALLLGSRRTVAAAFVVLLIQALLFAHGGLTTLGANVLTLGVVGPAVALLLARAGRAIGFGPAAVTAVTCAMADLTVYVADAGLLALGLAADGVSAGPTFAALVLALAPVQVVLALLEGAFSAGLVTAMARRDPARLPAWLVGRPRVKAAPVVAAALFIAFSPVANAEPGYPGLDEIVFEGTARRAGRTPKPLLSFEDSDLGKALWAAAMLAAGFVLGHGWARLRRSFASPPGPRVAEGHEDGRCR